MRIVFLAATLMACTSTPPTDEPIFAPPTPGFDLQWTGMATRGGLVSLDASVPLGVPEGTRVHFLISDQGIGPGDCPSRLSGECLDIGGRWFHVGTDFTIGTTASLTFTVPLQAPSVVGVQAVMLSPVQAYVSTPTELPIQFGVLVEGDRCGSAPDACDASLNCCASCGSQFGCPRTCAQPCDPTDIACQDGCWLYP